MAGLKVKNSRSRIPNGTVHLVPGDLRKALTSNPKIRNQWNNLTPLERNEWICWVISVVNPETRRNHIERLCEEFLDGKHRPCCWPGCSHR